MASVNVLLLRRLELRNPGWARLFFQLLPASLICGALKGAGLGLLAAAAGPTLEHPHGSPHETRLSPEKLTGLDALWLERSPSDSYQPLLCKYTPSFCFV